MIYNLTKIQFIQLLIMPILVFGIVYLWSDISIDNKDTNTNNVQVIKKSYKSTTKTDFYLYLHTIKEKYKLKILQEKFSNKSMQISFLASYDETILFLHELTQTIPIKTIKMTQEKDKYLTILYLGLKIFKETNIQDIEVLIPINLFEKETKMSEAIAIIDQYIYYKNKWYKRGDTFDGGEIIKIQIDGFHLKKDGKEDFVELFNDE